MRPSIHPNESELALLAGGDLRLWESWRARIHLRSCDRCGKKVAAFREGRQTLRTGLDELPAGVNWNALAEEMTANIHLGVEAGECVGPVLAKPDGFGWRATAVMAGMTILLLAAWWLNAPHRRVQPVMRSAQIEIRSTPAGIEVKEGPNAMTLMHPQSGVQPLVVSAPGVLRARYVDAETGQVTINHVYAD